MIANVQFYSGTAPITIPTQTATITTLGGYCAAVLKDKKVVPPKNKPHGPARIGKGGKEKRW